MLPPELAAGVSVERFRREIQLAAQLQHPHIVPLLTAGQADGLTYYIMPLSRASRCGRDWHARAPSDGRGGAARCATWRTRWPTRMPMASFTGTSSRITSCSRAGTRW